ncbi:hypothetical protein BIW11_04723 [Tropilaelaps mercedesae]|uniref:Uncharacterized protein n=1 Tax=Tropilaelaps mercedesae TaxID=418985 RepID=A0A1V9X2N4_9ACAR|nr:hypothetical protein BIW11_04723 [Tropilaelaps mercedesae]
MVLPGDDVLSIIQQKSLILVPLNRPYRLPTAHP